MFLVFGALALVLAAIGLYSVIAYGVAQRTQEIGVRIALGAGVSDIIRLVLGQGLRFAALGIVVGGAGAWWASKWVGPLLFSVSPKDPVVYGTVAVVLLAASGIYGVIAYFVSQRTQEIGVRIALGATTGDVVRLVLGQALRPVAIGAAIGVVGALAASRAIASQLFGVSRSDPLTIAAVVATLLGVALLASAVPARRAAAVDPTRALQAE